VWYFAPEPGSLLRKVGGGGVAGGGSGGRRESRRDLDHVQVNITNGLLPYKKEKYLGKWFSQPLPGDVTHEVDRFIKFYAQFVVASRMGKAHVPVVFDPRY